MSVPNKVELYNRWNEGPKKTLEELYSDGLQQWGDWFGDSFYPAFGVTDFGLAQAEDIPSDATSEQKKYYKAAHDFAKKLNVLNTEVFDQNRSAPGEEERSLTEGNWPGFPGSASIFDYNYYKKEVVPVFLLILEDLKVIQENVFYSEPQKLVDYFESFPAPWSWFGLDKAPPENIDQLIDAVLDSAVDFLELFPDVNFSLKKDVKPLPESGGLGPATILSDINLENSINFSNGNATHYIGFLFDSKKSLDQVRDKSYLPVRLAPEYDPKKLNLGWADQDYSILTNDGKFVNPTNKNSGNGIEIPLGLEIKVVEIVPSETGIWVGFVSDDPKLLDLGDVATLPGPKFTPRWDAITKNQTRLLYTKAEYVRIKESAILSQPDPYLSEKAVVGLKKSAVGQSIDAVVTTPGANPIDPEKSQDWTKIQPNDIRMRYYSFSKYNIKILGKGDKDKVFYNTDTIQTAPTLKLSEGYFYFVSGEAPRKTEGEIISDSENNIQDSEQEINSQKLISSNVTFEQIKQEAWKNLLEYLGKNPTGTNLNLYSRLYDEHFVLVDKKLRTQGANPNNQKALFTIRTSYVDSLPEDNSNYSNSFAEDSPFYNGKNYAVSLKLKDVKPRCEKIVKTLDALKKKINASDTNIQNPSGLKYEIKTQIELVKNLPLIIDDFLSRQAFPASTNQSFIHELMTEGINTESDHIIQIGIKDNKQIGGEVRETVSYIIFSPDPESLKDTNTQNSNLIYFDPYTTEPQITKAEDYIRAGLPLKLGLPRLRERLDGVYGSRALHLFLSYEKINKKHKIIGGESDLENSFMEFMSRFMVPPVKIFLSKNPSLVPEEEIDCQEILDKLDKSGPNVTQELKILQEKFYNSPKCMELLYSKFVEDTPATSPSLSKKQLEEKSLLTSSGGKTMDNEYVRVLYTQFFNVLDTESLIAMIMTCLGRALGVQMTSEAICRSAIKKLVSSLGSDQIETAMYASALLDPESQASIDFLAAYRGAPPFAPEEIDDVGESEDLALDASYQFSPISAQMAMSRKEEGAITEAIHNLEKSGVAIQFVPGTRPEGDMEISIPYGSSLFSDTNGYAIVSETYTWTEIDAERSRLISLGYSDNEASALMVRSGFIKPDPNQYQPILSGDEFSSPTSKFANSLRFDGMVKAETVEDIRAIGETVENWLTYMENLIGLQGICELLVGDILDGLKDLIRDPGAFVDGGAEGWWDDFVNKLKRSFSPPTLTFDFPENLMTDSHMGDYGKKLSKMLLSMIAMVLSQMVNVLIKRALEACLEEDSDIGPGGTAPNRQETIPLPLLNSVDLPPVGNLATPDIVAWMQDIIGSLNSKQTCALLRGDATLQLLQNCLAKTKSDWPVVYASGVDTVYEIRTAFETLGDNLGEELDVCNLLESAVPVPLIDDLCNASFDKEARALELQKSGLSAQEAQEQIDKEIEDLKNKVIGMTDLSLFGISPFSNSFPPMCGEGGSFEIPHGVEDTMQRATGYMLDSVKGALLKDMNGLQFFSTPPRSVLALEDPNQLESVHKMFSDAITYPYKRECLALVCDPQEFAEYYIDGADYRSYDPYTDTNNNNKDDSSSAIQIGYKGLDLQNVHEIYPITYNKYIHHGNMSTWTGGDKDATVSFQGLTQEQIDAIKNLADEKATEDADIHKLIYINNQEASFAENLKNNVLNLLKNDRDNKASLWQACQNSAFCYGTTKEAKKSAYETAKESYNRMKELIDKIEEAGTFNNDILNFSSFLLQNGGSQAENDVFLEALTFIEDLDVEADNVWTDKYNETYLKILTEELNSAEIDVEIKKQGTLSNDALDQFILTDPQISSDLKNYWQSTTGIKKPVDFFDRREIMPMHLGLLFDEYNLIGEGQTVDNAINNMADTILDQDVLSYVLSDNFKSFFESANVTDDAQFGTEISLNEINTRIDEEFLKDTKSIYLDKLIITPSQLFNPNSLIRNDSIPQAAPEGTEPGKIYQTNTNRSFPGNITEFNWWAWFLRQKYPLTTKLKDVNNNPEWWYVMLRNYTGLDLSPDDVNKRQFPPILLLPDLISYFDTNSADGYFSAIEMTAEQNSTDAVVLAFDGPNGIIAMDLDGDNLKWYNWIRISPGLRKLMPIMSQRQQDKSNVTFGTENHNHNIAYAFMELTIAEAAGLEIDRIRKFFPDISDVFFLEKTSIIFTVAERYQTEVVKEIKDFQGFIIDEDGQVILNADKDIVTSGPGFEREWNDGKGHPGRYGIHPFYLVYEKMFRDPELIFNKEPGEMIDYFSMDKDLVNKELFDFLSEDSVAGWTGTSQESQVDRMGINAYNFDKNNKNLNFNPNILKYDMPFTEFRNAPGIEGRNLVQDLTEIFSSTEGGEQLDAIASSMQVAQNNVSLVNQNVTLPLEHNINMQTSEIKDAYHVLKGKIDTSLMDKNSPPLPFSEDAILDQTYNFSFSDNFKDPAIKTIVSSLYSKTDAANILNQYRNPTTAPNGSDSEIDLVSFTGLSESTLNSGAKNPYMLEPINFRSQLFGKFVTNKFFDKFDSIYDDKFAFNKDWVSENNDTFKSNLEYFMSSYAYSGLQYAYSSQMFSKLKNSRLHERGMMKKIWKKILKSPFTSDVDPRCQDLFEQVSAPATGDRAATETDFFQIDSVKQNIMEFYKKSLCKDLYETSSDSTNAATLALIEGMVSLIVKVYALEMCLAAVIAWDSFDVEDIIQDKTLVKIIKQNISMDFDVEGNENTRGLSFFINDIVKKQEGLDSTRMAQTLYEGSSLEFLISIEAAQISSVIKNIFANSFPLNTSLELDILKNSDVDFVELYKQELRDSDDLFPAIKYGALYNEETKENEYVLDASFKNNIYTMNYGDPDKRSLIPIEDFDIEDSKSDIFGEYKTTIASGEPGNRPGPSRDNRKGNKSYLHSPLCNYYNKHAPIVGKEAESYDPKKQYTVQYKDWKSSTAIGGATTSADLAVEFGKLGALNNVKNQVFGFNEQIHLENFQETTAGNNFNAKLGNIIFQTYIKVEDYSPGEKRGYNLPIYIDNQGQFTEPCEGSSLFTELDIDDYDEILNELLNGREAENNIFKCHMFGTIPIPVWSYYYTQIFMKKILSYEIEGGIKPLRLLYMKYGLAPFFKKVSYGTRMVYTTPYPFSLPGLQLSEFKDNAFGVGVTPIDAESGKNPLKNSKCLFSQRPYFLKGQVADLPPYLGSEAFIKIAGTTEVLKELQIPLFETEREIKSHVKTGQGMTSFSVGESDAFSMQELGWWTEKLFFNTDSLGDLLKQENQTAVWHITKNWEQFFYKNLANDMLDDIKQSGEFKLMFEYFFPMKRYMALSFITASDGLSKFIPEPTFVLEETKRDLKATIRALLESNDYKYTPDSVINFLQNSGIADNRGTTGKDPDLTKEMLKIIYRTPLLILKGFVEVTDPAVAIAKAIIDISNTVAFATIAAIRAGVQVAKQTMQKGIDVAKQIMAQLEMQIGMSAGLVGAAVPPPFSPAVNVETSAENIADWTFEIVEEERDALLEEADEDTTAAWEAFESEFKELQELQKDYINAVEKLETLEAEKVKLEEGFEKKLKEADDTLKDVFQSPYLLPGLWASLIPSMIPYGGGIVPPPFFGGPPSTVPGMIYLALLLIDAIEEKTHDDIQNLNNDPNCEEEL